MIEIIDDQQDRMVHIVFDQTLIWFAGFVGLALQSHIFILPHEVG